MKGKERITILVNNYFKHTLTELERVELLQYLEDPLLSEHVNAVMEALWQEQEPLLQQFNLSERDAMIASLLATIQTKEGAKRKVLYMKMLRYAAMVAIIAGIGAFAFQKLQSNKQKAVDYTLRVKMEDQAGEMEKTVLTLSDGSKIVLDDSVKEMAISSKAQNNVLILKDGFLSYKTTPEAKDDPAYTKVLNTISTPKGKQYQIVLPDGTKAWLNAASSLTFPVVFSKESREVTVAGEVYFEVAPNKNAPFLVKTNNNLLIHVIGTNFNINAYDDESFVETTLIEGAVKVSCENQEILLQPRQQAKLNRDTKKMDVLAVDTETTLAWKNGYFYSKNSNLKEIMRQIERWFDVEVRYDGNAKPGTFSGSISKYLTLEQVLKIFELSDVKTKVDGRVITIVQ